MDLKTQGTGQNNNGQVSSLLCNLKQDFKEREVAEKAKQLNIGYIDIRQIVINPDVLQFVSQEESLKGSIIPFFRIGNKLKVALTDPKNPDTLAIIDKIKSQKMDVATFLCSPESLTAAQKIFGAGLHYEEKEIVAKTDDQIANVEQEILKINELPIVMAKMKTDEALNLLHEEILKLGASDLHIEPKKTNYRVRARVDGSLLDFFTLETDLAKGLIRQIKHNAHLKFNVENIPQDGKFSFKATDRNVDVRVSTLPANHGEGIVLRFLDPKKGLVPLKDLGISEKGLERVEKAFSYTNGLVLVTGPTGSGKTTTLHSALSEINEPDKKIITLEDPVEFEIEGLLQCEVDEEVGFTFASGLRSILRQDPDVVMIGEIRDIETAETAVQASLTGHLVLSTLHTNSSADAIPRLLNIGVAPFILSPAIKLIVAQRLVRTLCKNCVQMQKPTDSEKQEIEIVLKNLEERGYKISIPAELPKEKGCSECSNTGFRGQTLVAEVLLIDDSMREMIQQGLTSKTILNAAKKSGMCTMWEEGIIKVTQGITSFSEIIRRIGRDR